MLIFNETLSVSPVTTHVQINDVTRKIDRRKIINNVTNINDFYKEFLGYKPNIAVTGLNPHCETFRGKDIEKTEILPAIKILRKKKIKAFGPFSADTIFLKDNRKKFNVIVGMYHDQVLAPLKSLYDFKAINITLGLPFIRVTPDHGIGTDIIKKNIADPSSLYECINFFKKIKRL